ncbi:MAG: hypothetical protein A3G13_02120 [Candidatus Levybacteria bacterium RIFCSPLOWO2_12_FULL_37_7]|nr:MAG: hypothetical protein A2770_02515 [Candidatus Levybacteria bacterium RIFCSPHIGHO2_01_FULL_38_12]OGH44374.1 MAG: hypothetical protein A3J14_02220 [Candidatus Levybacteria bacterium RIFCSPLOWO2_02_FULL_37_18]OGH52494.1 MAG: hypothetical protein A3G13_02120 [Candidatus Levybacteria bacterium RIFCSPLOWO2_12_FULL_37_7]
MIDLTNPQDFKKIDPKNIYGSTEMLPDQCDQIWRDGKAVCFPKDYKEVENIVIAGMGGSAYGGHVISSLYRNNLPVPHVVHSDYELPGFVNEHTLIIIESYSGSTEESLSALENAKRRNAKITGLTSGGKLREVLKTNYPSLVFKPIHNPSGQPRLGAGYMVLGTISLLSQIGLLKIPDSEVIQAVSELREQQRSIKEGARQLASALQGYIPVIFSAEHLVGNAHILRNQFNETSKSFSAFSPLPELNHHLMEGLKNPTDKKLTILFLSSSLYSPVIQKRLELTKDVVTKNNIPFVEYQAQGTDELSQMLNVLSFGGYLSLYLALLYGLDPSLIPWVDYFKEQLKNKTSPRL